MHDTFPTGTAQDKTLTFHLFHKPFHRVTEILLRFELPPSWNNIHDTLPTGTAQDKTLTFHLFHKPFHRVTEILHEKIPLTVVSDTDVQYY